MLRTAQLLQYISKQVFQEESKQEIGSIRIYLIGVVICYFAFLVGICVWIMDF